MAGDAARFLKGLLDDRLMESPGDRLPIQETRFKG